MVIMAESEGGQLTQTTQTTTPTTTIPQTTLTSTTLPPILTFPITLVKEASIKYSEVVDEATHCLSKDMTDQEIRIEFIEVWSDFDVPIINWNDLIWSTNWSNLAERTALINALKAKKNELTVMNNGKYNIDEQKRINTILQNMKEVRETYETEAQFWDERLRENIRNSIRGLSLIGKIILVCAIIIGIAITGLIGYNFLKSYGIEKGKVLAHK